MIENSIIDLVINNFGIILLSLFVFLIVFSWHKLRVYSENNSPKIKYNDYKHSIQTTILFPGSAHIDYISLKSTVGLICLYIIILMLCSTIFSNNIFWFFFIIYRIILVQNISEIISEINNGKRSVIEGDFVKQTLILVIAIFTILPVLGLNLSFDVSSNIFEITLQIFAILLGFCGILLFEFYRTLIDIRLKYPTLKSIVKNFRNSIVNENFVVILFIFTLGIIFSFTGIILEVNKIEWITPLLFIMNCGSISLLGWTIFLLWRSYSKFIDSIDELIDSIDELNDKIDKILAKLKT